LGFALGLLGENGWRRGCANAASPVNLEQRRTNQFNIGVCVDVTARRRRPRVNATGDDDVTNALARCAESPSDAAQRPRLADYSDATIR